MIAIIIYGPPGAGKGTQAQLLADKLNLIHFDTGRYIRDLIYNSKLKNDKIILQERKLNESGQLNTPSWVFKIISDKINEIDRLKKSVVLSGSPRTMIEAFGDKNKKGLPAGRQGLFEILEKNYGKKNIYIFVLNLSEKESVERNSRRLICSQCRLPVLAKVLKSQNFEIKNCLFCGGKLIKRFDDAKKEIIARRFKEYQNQTVPIVKELEKRKYKVIKINAASMPFQIHQKIISWLTPLEV
ncbi:nucleoside monophosphate kinase [Candidatus Wolfebacteria bacterium]|nr:nucleoside monophosphate kinase [Candidatus Wolfebacteria bacterium]